MSNSSKSMRLNAPQPRARESLRSLLSSRKRLRPYYEESVVSHEAPEFIAIPDANESGSPSQRAEQTKVMLHDLVPYLSITDNDPMFTEPQQAAQITTLTTPLIAPPAAAVVAAPPPPPAAAWMAPPLTKEERDRARFGQRNGRCGLLGQVEEPTWDEASLARALRLYFGDVESVTMMPSKANESKLFRQIIFDNDFSEIFEKFHTICFVDFDEYFSFWSRGTRFPQNTLVWLFTKTPWSLPQGWPKVLKDSVLKRQVLVTRDFSKRKLSQLIIDAVEYVHKITDPDTCQFHLIGRRRYPKRNLDEMRDEGRRFL